MPLKPLLSRAPGNGRHAGLVGVSPAHGAKQAVLVAEPVVDASVALIGLLRSGRVVEVIACRLGAGDDGWLGSGNCCRSLLKAGSKRFAGILLPGNAVREIGAAAVPVVDRGS